MFLIIFIPHLDPGSRGSLFDFCFPVPGGSYQLAKTDTPFTFHIHSIRHLRHSLFFFFFGRSIIKVEDEWS